MAITVPVTMEDRVSAAADKASSSVNKLAKTFDDVNAAALRVASVAATASSAAAKGQIEAARETLNHATTLEQVAAAEAKVNKAVSKNVTAQKKLARLRATSDKDDAKAITKRAKALKFLGKVSAGIGIAIAIGLGIKKTVEFASEITATRRKLSNMLAILTKGKGSKALEVMTVLSKKLGITVAAASAGFKKFRTAGLDNRQSVAMIKFKADIEALLGPTADTEAAVNKAMKAIKGGEDAAAVTKRLAKAFGVAGDGSKAMSVSVETLDGKMARINERYEASKTKFAQPFADGVLKTMDVFDALGKKVGNVDDLIGGFASSLSASIGSAAGSASGSLDGIISTITSLPSKALETIAAWTSAGAAFMQGVVDGALSIDLIGAVSNMASGALKAIKSTFGISSPSKEGKAIGGNVGGSIKDSIEATPPPKIALPQAPAIAADLAPAGGGGGGVNVDSITIIVQGSDNAPATAREVRRELAAYFNQTAFSGGTA